MLIEFSSLFVISPPFVTMLIMLGLRRKYLKVSLLVLAIILVVGAVAYFAHKKQINDFDVSTETKSAQSVGDDFILKVQKNDSAALKLTTQSFQNNPSPYVKNSSLQQFQSQKKAESSNWVVVPPKGNNPATAKATYTTYISVKGNQSAQYTMRLQKINSEWLVSEFDISP